MTSPLMHIVYFININLKHFADTCDSKTPKTWVCYAANSNHVDVPKPLCHMSNHFIKKKKMEPDMIKITLDFDSLSL